MATLINKENRKNMEIINKIKYIDNVNEEEKY